MVICEGCRQEIPRDEINTRHDLEVSMRGKHKKQYHIEIEGDDEEELSLKRPKQVIDLEKLVKKKKCNDGEAEKTPVPKYKSAPSQKPQEDKEKQ